MSPARLGLSLSGRGTGPDRGRCRLRGSAGPLRHRVLARSSRAATAAARRWSGRHEPATAAFPAAGPGCRSPIEHLCHWPSTRRTAIRTRLLHFYRRDDRLPARAIRRFEGQRSSWSRPRTTISASSASTRNTRIFCAFNLSATCPPRSPCRRATGADRTDGRAVRRQRTGKDVTLPAWQALYRLAAGE